MMGPWFWTLYSAITTRGATWYLGSRGFDFNWHNQAELQYNTMTSQVFHNNAWQNQRRVVCTWSANDSYSCLEEAWINGSWENYYKVELDRDQFGHDLATKFWLWNNNTYEHQQTIRNTYTLDAQTAPWKF